MLFMYSNILSFAIGISNDNILPPININYKTTFTIPLIARQTINYKRLNECTSQLILNGKINCVGYIHLNDNDDISSYTLDDILMNILNKNRCTIENPKYDNEKDIITLILNIRLLKFKKLIILENKL